MGSLAPLGRPLQLRCPSQFSASLHRYGTSPFHIPTAPASLARLLLCVLCNRASVHWSSGGAPGTALFDVIPGGGWHSVYLLHHLTRTPIRAGFEQFFFFFSLLISSHSFIIVLFLEP